MITVLLREGRCDAVLKMEKRHAKEKERAAREKAAQLEKEKAAKEKAKEKARLAKEKAAQLEKEIKEQKRQQELEEEAYFADEKRELQ